MYIALNVVKSTKVLMIFNSYFSLKYHEDNIKPRRFPSLLNRPGFIGELKLNPTD